jgi:hypothetical protein
MALPTDAKARKDTPVWSGCIAYFPDALVAVAQLSFAANEQHNPGEPLHWAKEKSTDEQDAGMRHAIEPLLVGGSEYDGDGFAHKVKKAWRALAELQRFLDAGNVARAPVVMFDAAPDTGVGGLKFVAGGTSRLDLCFACAGAPDLPHIETCEKFSRVSVCKECGRDLDEPHAPNCSHNFQKRAPTICSDCGVDLDQNAHAAGCLRLNQPMV